MGLVSLLPVSSLVCHVVITAIGSYDVTHFGGVQ